jgi:hypothetical protein
VDFRAIERSKNSTLRGTICDKEVDTMCKRHPIALGIALLLILSGCGKTPQPTNQEQAKNGQEATETVTKADGPAAAVTEFLEAVRTGNDEVASRMLSKLARQKTAALNRSVTPPASDTAKFTVGKVDMIGEDGARVACTWTDLDPDRQPKTDEAFWVVRREDDGWRIAGVAAQVFPGEPPLLLNFEDPDDMFRKQQWVREEMRRRMEKEEAGLQAQGPEEQKKPVRR